MELTELQDDAEANPAACFLDRKAFGAGVSERVENKSHALGHRLINRIQMRAATSLTTAR